LHFGNELSGDFNVMKEFLTHFKSVDSRHLMAYGSNNYLGSGARLKVRIIMLPAGFGADTDTTYKTQIRGSFSLLMQTMVALLMAAIHHQPCELFQAAISKVHSSGGRHGGRSNTRSILITDGD